MLLPNFLAFLIKSGLLFTGGLVTFRAIGSIVNPPLRLTPIVRTSDGDIQGRIAFSRNGSDYWQFLGIPYAMPPVRSLRFQPPVPAKRWGNLRKTIHYPPACLQYEPVILLRASGQEDCLYLNVFVNPAKTSNKKLVVVFIHGGGFFSGDTNLYHPDYFMDHPIIVVTLNYRLGPFGFLNFQENDPQRRLPRGNMGLKDQNLALEWIQRNIQYFGGDPKKVTIMGESAGAVSVHLHMLSQMSNGLFQRAMIISGSALGKWGFSENPRKIAKNYAYHVGCPTGNWTKMFQCFMKYDARNLVTPQYAWADPLHEKDLFLPSREIGPFLDDNVFLKDNPENLLRNLVENQKNAGAGVPLMIGVSSGEGGVRSARFQAMPELIPKLDKNWNQLIGRFLLEDNPVLKPRIAENLRNFYFGNGTRITGDVQNFMRNLTKLASDVLFYEPFHKTVMEHSKIGKTFVFYFDYQSVMLPGAYSYFRSVRREDRGLSEVKLFRGLWEDWVGEHMLGGRGAHRYGIGHGEGLYQLWNINGLSKWLSDGDMRFSRGFVQSVVDFANNVETLTFRGTEWPTVSSGVLKRAPEMLVPFMLMDNGDRGRLTEEPFYRGRLEILNQIFAR